MPLIKANKSNSSNLELPTYIKLSAANNDCIFMIDGTIQAPYKVTKENFLAGVSSGNSEFTAPTIIKNIAANTDYFIGIDAEGLLYKISKSDLLAGLSGGTGTNGSSSSDTDPYFSEVAFLSHGDSLIDVTGKTITLGSNAKISTISPLFSGGASFFFDGNADYVQLPNSSDLDFSTGKEFLIEFFVRLFSLSGLKVLLARSIVNSDNTFNLDISPSNIRITGWYSVYINQPHEMLLNTWNYITIEKQGNTLILSINNITKGAFTGVTNFPNIGNFCFGGDPLSGASETIDGQITEIRITKKARTITSVPTQKFPDK